MQNKMLPLNYSFHFIPLYKYQPRNFTCKTVQQKDVSERLGCRRSVPSRQGVE